MDGGIMELGSMIKRFLIGAKCRGKQLSLIFAIKVFVCDNVIVLTQSALVSRYFSSRENEACASVSVVATSEMTISPDKFRSNDSVWFSVRLGTMAAFSPARRGRKEVAC